MVRGKEYQRPSFRGVGAWLRRPVNNIVVLVTDNAAKMEKVRAFVNFKPDRSKIVQHTGGFGLSSLNEVLCLASKNSV